MFHSKKKNVVRHNPKLWNEVIIDNQVMFISKNTINGCIDVHDAQGYIINRIQLYSTKENSK